MTAIFSKITGKAQTTVPKQVREALGVKPGDLLIYRIAKGGKVTLAKGEPLDRAYLKAVEATMSEWTSPADKAAYDAQARKLVSMFRDNFRKFEAHVGQDVLQAAPELAEAAE